MHGKAIPLRDHWRSCLFRGLLGLGTWLVQPGPAEAADDPTPAEARNALVRAVSFFRTDVAEEGGYLWKYSADLTRREGEGKVSGRTVWVQPPGTPAVGLAMLQAYQLCGESSCRVGAIDAAKLLVRGQLHSGGWTYRIELDPDARKKAAYRVAGKPRDKARDVSTLDDNTTQAALLLMMRVDRELGFRDPDIHESAMFALHSLLRVQVACGGWSQGFTSTFDPTRCTADAARFPDTWSRTYPGHNQYWYQPTLNDGLMADLLPVLLEAAEIYNDDSFRQAALRGGEFFLRAQLPEPQPGWAQQYSDDLEPIWARKFEPPAITGNESRRVIQTLLDLYRVTGDRKWLAPIPSALAYYRQCELPDGRLARFYEMGSNRPLYFTRDYDLTYDDSDVPTHYSFSVASWVEGLRRSFETVRNLDPASLPKSRRAPKMTCSPNQARTLINALDPRGAWVDRKPLRYQGDNDPTTHVIDCATFVENLPRLAAYAGRD